MIALEGGGGWRLLEVDTQQLLLPADHTQLDDRGHRGIAREPAIDTRLAGERLDARARFVVADHPDQTGARAERGEVVRDIGRAAQPFVAAGDGLVGSGRDP